MAERNSSSSRTSERGGMGSATATAAEHDVSGQGQQPGEGGLASKVKERATSQLNTQKDRATEGLGTVAHAVRQSTRQLRDEHHETLAGYIEQAANQIDRLSQGLRNKDVGELLRDAQRLAQRRPAVFVGSAFALGLIGARFLKSSPPHEREYGRESYPGGSSERGYGGSPAGPFAGGYTPGTASGAAGTTRKPGTTGTTGTAGAPPSRGRTTPESPSSTPPSSDIRGTGRS